MTPVYGQAPRAGNSAAVKYSHLGEIDVASTPSLSSASPEAHKSNSGSTRAVAISGGRQPAYIAPEQPEAIDDAQHVYEAVDYSQMASAVAPAVYGGASST